MRRVSGIAVMLSLLAVASGGTASGRGARPHVAAQASPVLVGVTAGHHPGFDRIVFRFSGPLPSHRRVAYVDRLIADASGKTIPIAGRAILRVSLRSAAAHDPAGRVTAPDHLAFALPNVMSVQRAGDFEAVVSYGIGLARRSSLHVFTLTRPSRVVIDIGAAFRTVRRRVYLFNQRNYLANRSPFFSAVLRPVLPSSPATGVMDRLFAGPTRAEYARGLRLLRSKATGYAGLGISAGVARLKLLGGCSSGGSTVSIADEILPTLTHLPGVRYVKILDPSGHTESPTGSSDSRPSCLEP